MDELPVYQIFSRDPAGWCTVALIAIILPLIVHHSRMMYGTLRSIIDSMSDLVKRVTVLEDAFRSDVPKNPN